MMSDLLKKIDSPADLRRLSPGQLPTLADELRNYIVEQVSRTGGHLSSNLGTVELTVALHYVFNTPNDRIVWDVGHQTYPHKILTGRRDLMPTLRQAGGLSGFPKRSESEYDAFGTAHSSTSISAALGMAVASRNLGVKRKHIAVIGDGAMTAGMAFEAMNNAGVTPDVDLLVILNDNDMSISPPVGALNKYLAKLMSGRMMNTAKEVGKGILGVAPPLYELAHRLEEHVKGMMTPATLFEEFGFNYYGPIDGHDLDALIPTLQNLRALHGPIFLHVITKKGAGYKLAEQDPVLYHGPGKFDPTVGIQKSTGPKPPTYTQVFGRWLCDMAQADRRLIGITPAMREGSGMVEFERRFPSRYFDVGIAEQHAVTFAAGIACEGLKPVVAIYSTFLQRAYDQLIHDVALQNLDVTFALDRAGLVGADGATHAGNYDIAYLRCIPNMVIATPSSEDECRKLLSSAYKYPGCAAVRYPRGVGPGVVCDESLDGLELGKALVRFVPDNDAKPLVMLAFGSMLTPSLDAARELGVTVVDMRWVKPLDEALILQFAEQRYGFVTLEEGCIMGGAGSAVSELLRAHGLNNPVLQLGLPDQFIDHGDPSVLLKNAGLDAAGVRESVEKYFGELFSRQSNVVRPITGRAANQ
ncbi:MAG TPA: 1-deoxy-D-xylulose-5-phosphate synthase [Limnobacter sp.]|uniref:1-deoxy-D-xylulose-5-phosphate synthase n=1 Tax=Limnobacter sp. TaxID=2003368 RepID=UPI002E316095|nr:1-deoxy-D-xylulose-5-phosphate synthase [Limnobacter sp.]HEX5487150.1 1-deoxy-D-xylulose-5-phosphate synthase [Limnobacter sp.]